MDPSHILKTDFGERGRFNLVTPKRPTMYTKKAQSKIDYFIVSVALHALIKDVQSLVDFNSSPHRPVSLTVLLDRTVLIPVLRKPARFPAEAMIGPQLPHADWRHLSAAAAELLEQLSAGQCFETHQRLLDTYYTMFAKALAEEVARITRTSIKSNRPRGLGPTVEWRPADEFKTDGKGRGSFVSKAATLRRIANSLQDVQRCLAMGAPMGGSLG